MTNMRTYRTASGMTVEQSGHAYGQPAFDALGRVLYGELQNVLGQSLPLVPVDTGALRGSGYVTEPERKGDHLTIEVGYGGVATKINPKTGEPTNEYALFVHENLEAHHKVGQAKYLQVPFDEWTKDGGRRISEGMDRQMSGSEGLAQDLSGGAGEVPK